MDSNLLNIYLFGPPKLTVYSFFSSIWTTPEEHVYKMVYWIGKVDRQPHPDVVYSTVNSIKIYVNVNDLPFVSE